MTATRTDAVRLDDSAAADPSTCRSGYARHHQAVPCGTTHSWGAPPAAAMRSKSAS